MTSTAHNCGGPRRLSGAAAAAEAEEAATAVCSRPRQRLRHSGALSAPVAVASSISPPMIGHDFGGAAASIFMWFVVFIFTSSTPAAASRHRARFYGLFAFYFYICHKHGPS